jgi:hypothetical protein
MTCRPEQFTPFSWEPAALKEAGQEADRNDITWIWRRSDSERVRRQKWWQPWFFDNFRQRSHYLRGDRGRSASWPASFLFRSPPRMAGRGVQEIAWRRTSPRLSGGNKSAAWSAWRSPAAILTKAKKTKCRNYNCFFFFQFSGNQVFTLHTLYSVHLNSINSLNSWFICLINYIRCENEISCSK